MSFHHRLILAAAIAAVGTFGAPRAEAAFSEFQSLGGTKVLSDVACVSAGNGAVCAARSVDSKLAVNKYNGSKWSGWETIGSNVVSAPSCATVSDKAVICAARHGGGGIVIARYTKSWGKPKIVAGDTSSAPSCAGVGNDAAVCVSRGVDGALNWLKTDGADATGEFARLAGATTAAPRCSSDNRLNPTRAVICLFGNPDSHIYARRFNGDSATPAIDLGGQSYFETTCTELGRGTGGKVTCVAKNFNSNLFLNTFSGGAFATTGWSGFTGIGGLSSGVPSCGSIAFNQIGCALIGTDQQFFIFQVVNGVFSGFTALGGVWQGSPNCFSLSIGKVMCVAVGIDGVAKSTVGP